MAQHPLDEGFRRVYPQEAFERFSRWRLSSPPLIVPICPSLSFSRYFSFRNSIRSHSCDDLLSAYLPDGGSPLLSHDAERPFSSSPLSGLHSVILTQERTARTEPNPPLPPPPSPPSVLFLVVSCPLSRAGLVSRGPRLYVVRRTLIVSFCSTLVSV